MWTVDGVVLNARDTAGVEWIVDEYEGWDDGAPVRVSIEERPQADGAFDAPSYRGARVITLGGGAVAPNRAARKAAISRLKAAMSDGTSLYPVSVDDDGDELVVFARLSAEPRAKRVGENAFTFQLVLVAPDPRKYSADPTAVTLTLPESTSTGGFTAPFTAPFTSVIPEGSTGERTVVNEGDADTWPTISIAGPVTDPVIENVTTGRRLRLSYTVGAGDHLLVDFADSVVLLNGNTPVDAHGVGSSWWPLVPGANVLRYSAFAGASGSPASITYRSAWI